MVKLLLAVAGFLSLSTLVCSQEYDADTLYLKEVLIRGLENERYQTNGDPLVVADSAHEGSLSELISRALPVYFVRYGGKGQLSAINLRGLGGSRTNLLWNGMEINSWTLGSSDFNILNGMNGSVSVVRGSSSALYGNGSIGGAVSLRSERLVRPGHSLAFGQGIGSFGERNTKLTHSYKNKRYETYTTFYYLTINNNYTYELNGEKTEQNNAGYFTINLSHHSGYWISPSDKLTFDFWFAYNNREIQPIKGNTTSDDFLVDRNFRSVISWERVGKNSQSETKIGFTSDSQIFNSLAEVKVNRTFFSYQTAGEINDHLKFKAGVTGNILRAITSNFEKNIQEVRTDIYFSAVWTPLEKLTFSANLREPLLNEKFQPFVPAFGISYQVASDEKMKIVADVQLSRAYRLPTLNDRYWEPGGNPDLQPELSRNLEMGTKFSTESAKTTFSWSVRYFYHDVDNWIIWRPGGSDVTDDGQQINFWFPDNIRRVTASGVESDIAFRYALRKSNSFIEFSNGAQYTKAINRQVISRFDRSLNKQLPYSPSFVILNKLTFQYNKWNVSLINRITSERFTEANNELTPLPSYSLTDLSLMRKWKSANFDYSVHLAINNLANVDYENFRNTAMPGRSFELQFNILFNFEN